MLIPENLFDENIHRTVVPALKTHPKVLGGSSENLFAAGVADMDFKAPPCVLHAMQERLNHGVFGYEALPDELFCALIRWFDHRHRWKIEEEIILKAPNVLNGLATAAQSFTDQGDGIIVQPPVFFDFYDIIKENNRRLVTNPLLLKDGFYKMDLEGLDRLAQDPKNKMLFLCNPHNPIGRVWSKSELMAVGDVCERNGVIVVSDEIHGDITFPGHPYTPFGSMGDRYADNSITLISPAKSFNIPSCCTAFTLVPNKVKRQRMNIENSRLTVNKNNAFANVAMEAAYRDGESWLDAVIEYLAGNLILLENELAHISGVQLIKPEGTFLVWLDFRELGLSPDELTDFLKFKARWSITRGVAFGDEGIGFMRLNIACPRLKLKQALGFLSDAVSRLSPKKDHKHDHKNDHKKDYE